MRLGGACPSLGRSRAAVKPSAKDARPQPCRGEGSARGHAHAAGRSGILGPQTRDTCSSHGVLHGATHDIAIRFRAASKCEGQRGHDGGRGLSVAYWEGTSVSLAAGRSQVLEMSLGSRPHTGEGPSGA